MSRARKSGTLDGLFILLLSSQIFLIVTFARVIGDLGSAEFGTGIIEVVLAQTIWGTHLAAELAKFAGTLVLLHAALAVAAWLLARLTGTAWPDNRNSQRSLAVFWFLCLVLWLLAANANWYPFSSLGAPYHALIRSGVGGITLFSALSAALIFAILAVAVTFAMRHRALARSRTVWIGSVACLAAGAALPVIRASDDASGTLRDERPNVVLIGIDSLRTDFVQNDRPQLAPAVDAFLADAVRFSNAYTPLARTFPAWVSLISGRHPHTTGAFVNLLPRDLIDEGETLPETLSAVGYRTVYAIDEVRFSNLDQSYGFDEMLAPPMGATDFMLGFFADTPLANIFVNTRFGDWLFPHAYANRGAAVTYDPRTFVDRIDRAVSFDEPTLLAIHLTLVHWPYLWATAPTASMDEQPSLSREERARRDYSMAVRGVDEQFRSVMEMLESKGALQNAVVIVLSDHGESLGEPSMLFDHDNAIDQLLGTQSIVGHGNHVFSRDQYQVVLGMRSYGNELIPNGADVSLDMPVSLEDVTPTVLDLLNLGEEQQFDGRSLMPYLQDGQHAVAGERIRFLETEFNPAGVSPDVLVTTSAMSTAIEKYEFDPDSDRVQVRKEFIEEMLNTRQYAAESGGTILASIPAEDYRQQHLLYYDARNGRPYWLDAPPTTADGAVLVALWEALEQRFSVVRERPILPPPQFGLQPTHAASP